MVKEWKIQHYAVVAINRDPNPSLQPSFWVVSREWRELIIRIKMTDRAASLKMKNFCCALKLAGAIALNPKALHPKPKILTLNPKS